MATFAEFVAMCHRLEATPKRREREDIIASFLKTLPESEVAPAVYFTIGRVFGERDSRVLNVSYMTVAKISSHARQASLSHEPSTIEMVWRNFCEIAERSGEGSSKRRENMLRALFGSASSEEATYMAKILFGEMRHGVSEGVMLSAITRASGLSLEKVRRAHMVTGDIGETARIALYHPAQIEVGITLFVPVKPMLAESEEDFSTILEEHGGRTALEFKFDGARIQIHKKEEKVKIFSRRLSDVTESLPEVVEVASDLHAGECIVEGEVIAFREKPMAFQELMKRFRRISGVERAASEIPIRLFLFDILTCEGKSLLDEPNMKRWEMLQSITPPRLLAERTVVTSVQEAETFFRRALEAGHEGLMAKDLHSPYQPGNRGKRWFKIKKADTVDCVILAADWGSGRRQGWLSNYHLGVYDEENDEYLVVGKTFKGLTDEEFSSITARLLSIKTDESDWTVSVKPEIIVEVAFNEIQRSPSYKSGFALRFARITRFREDKSEPDTLERLRTMFERQFEKKGRL